MMARSTKLSDEIENKALTDVSSTSPEVDDIQDIKIEGAKRKRFRINGDNNKILELNTNDIGVSYRLTEAYKRLNDLMEKVQATLENVPDAENLDDENYQTVTNGLKELNDAMCKEVDFIFDAPVSSICLDGLSMYAPSNGMFMYEHIIDSITELYETDLNHEFTLMRQRVSERTKRYTSATKKKYRPKK